MYKLHVSANSGHHQVYYRFKRKSYIVIVLYTVVIVLYTVVIVLYTVVIVLYTVTTPDIKITKIDTRDLFINTPTQIYDFPLNR